MVRHLRERMPDVNKRLMKALQVELTNALQMQRARIWLDLERLIKARDRGLIIAGVEVEQRAAVGCFEAARVGLKCLVETEPGLIAALLLHQKLAEPVPLPGGSRLQHQAP